MRQRFEVSYDFPVYFVNGVLDEGNPLLAETMDRLEEGRKHRAVVYVDGGLSQARPELITDVKNYFHAHDDRLELAGSPIVIPGGPEAKKDWNLVKDVMWTLGNLHLDRQSYVLAIGGGNALDMIGFAASIVHRGLRLVRMPSTTLAQADAGLGVKNGMDEHGQKNFVGAFAPPFAVINDFDLLDTLSDADWISGVAEAFKVAIIKDRKFFERLRGDALALRRRDRAAMERTVRRSGEIHLNHIATSGDPFEFGSARPLDFGHWAAHRLEILSDHRLRHGHAVSIGIALDSCYAREKSLLSESELLGVLKALDDCALPTWDDLLELRSNDGILAVLEGIDQFREHLGGVLNVTLPDGIGRKIEVHHMNIDVIEKSVRYLKAGEWKNEM